MPLLAHDTLTDVVLVAGSATNEEWATVHRQRTGARLRCRGCDGALVARVSPNGLRHFAHFRRPEGCPWSGETARHLSLKQRFLDGFRAAGWAAELEVVGEGWKADVLAASPMGERVAVEVQVSPITVDAVLERTGRHGRDGVNTLWVAVGKRRLWTREVLHVCVSDDDDRIIDSVYVSPVDGVRVPAKRPRLRLAEPVSVERFTLRWAHGRLTPIRESARRQLWEAQPTTSAWVHLDSCVDLWVAEREQAEREQAERERLKKVRRDNETAHMAESLRALELWAAQDRWRFFYGPLHLADIDDAVGNDRWDPQFGMGVYYGRAAAEYMFAVAEPRHYRSRTDRRVAAWTTGLDPASDVSGWPKVIGPASALDALGLPGINMKPLRSQRRRNRW
jgi:hypothetical protein